MSHADPIKAAVAHALGTHLDLFQRIVISPCSVTAIALRRRRPRRARRELTPATSSSLVPVVSVVDMTEYLDPDAFTAGAVGQPGQRVFYLQAATTPRSVGPRWRSSRWRALAEYLAGCSPTCRPERRPGCRPRAHASRSRPSGSSGTIGVAYDERARPHRHRGRGAGAPRTRPTTGDSRCGSSSAVPQVRGLHRARRGADGGGRPPCRLCGAPDRPRGHVCPRTN